VVPEDVAREANLADNSTVVFGSNIYLAGYEGGDGNDFTLTTP